MHTPPANDRRRRYGSRTVALWGGLLLAVAGCSDTTDTRSETYGLPSTLQDLQSEDWVLDGSASTPVVEAGTATLSFDEDDVHGSTPCTTYRGPVDVDDDGTLDIGPLTTTARACDDDRTTTERRFLDGLEAVDHVDVDLEDDRLTLTGDDTELIFDAVDDDVTLEASWSVVELAADGDVVAVDAGAEPSLTFTASGDAVAETSCSRIEASWERDGESLEFGETSLTTAECDDDDAPGAEDGLATALATTAAFELAPGRLVLLDDRDRVLVVATSADQP